MAKTVNPVFRAKADANKRELLHEKRAPQRFVEFVEDEAAYQRIAVVEEKARQFPVLMKQGDSVILDFGRHCVGYFHYELAGTDAGIVDAPTVLEFKFGEFPLEIEKPAEEYKGWIGSGWIQRETRSAVFMPYASTLERRYAFRYVKITRLDSCNFPVALHDVSVDCVSAVRIEDVPVFDIPDARLKTIYDASLLTLKQCEQDVFEDGPKRDRRLWIGDLRLQAVSDYVSFRNLPLIRRCLYLFAAYRTSSGAVPPCLFQDSPPYIDEWNFTDYSLFFVSCLYDYWKNTGDEEMTRELYPTAKSQIERTMGLFDEQERIVGGELFVDWCLQLDKSVAGLGIYLYTLRQFKELSEALDIRCDGIAQEMARVEAALRTYYVEEKGVFVAKSGQISWHSQVWAVLSGILSAEEGAKLLDRTKEAQPTHIMHTPYMHHFYLDALDRVGRKSEVLEEIRSYWGQMADKGFDTCLEVFNPDDDFESYNDAVEINSACHAWSCTPVYWIHKYFAGK